MADLGVGGALFRLELDERPAKREKFKVTISKVHFKRRF